MVFIGGGRLFTVLFAAALVMFSVTGVRAGNAVLHYSFEETENGLIKDLSGNGYHGEIRGEPERVSGGLRFGGESCIVIPEVEAMNVGAGGFAVEAVIELEPDVPWSMNGVSFILTANYKEHARAWEMYLDAERRLMFTVRDPTGTWTASGSAEPVPAGKPVHIAASLDEDDMWDTMKREIYINGKRQPHVQRGAAVKSGNNIEITVGALMPGRNHLQAIFREIRLYDRPLTGEGDPVIERGRRLAEKEDED